MGRKIRRTVLVILVILLFSLLPPPVAAEEEAVIEVEGFAVVKEGNLLRARELAVSDGLRSAVEQVVGLLVDSRTRVHNYELIEDTILIRSAGYIAGYEILSTRLVEGTLGVRLRVRVRREELVRDLDHLQLILYRANDPRIMVVIPEEHLRRLVPDPAAETEVIRRLVDAGFRLVDQRQVAKVRDSEVLRQAVAGDEEARRRLAAEYNAEILVTGEAFSEFVGNFRGLISCRARVEVRVIRADTGEILAAHAVHESGVDISEAAAGKKALTKAGSSIADYLVEAIPARLVENRRSIQVFISNVTFSDLLLIEDNLKKTPLVENVFIRDFTGGNARLDVETVLLPVQLGEEMTWWPEIPLEVTGISGAKVELEKKTFPGEAIEEVLNDEKEKDPDPIGINL